MMIRIGSDEVVSRNTFLRLKAGGESSFRFRTLDTKASIELNSLSGLKAYKEEIMRGTRMGAYFQLKENQVIRLQVKLIRNMIHK